MGFKLVCTSLLNKLSSRFHNKVKFNLLWFKKFRISHSSILGYTIYWRTSSDIFWTLLLRRFGSLLFALSHQRIFSKTPSYKFNTAGVFDCVTGEGLVKKHKTTSNDWKINFTLIKKKRYFLTNTISVNIESQSSHRTGKKRKTTTTKQNQNTELWIATGWNWWDESF